MHQHVLKVLHLFVIFAVEQANCVVSALNSLSKCRGKGQTARFCQVKPREKAKDNDQGE